MFLTGTMKARNGRSRTYFVRSFGWKDMVDLGNITTARGTEMYLPLWLGLWGALGTGTFNIKVAR